MTDLTPNHPAVEALARRYAAEMDWSMSADGLPGRDLIIQDARAFLTAALPHLTADDLPTRLVRDIQVRTIRATARAATYEEDGTPWDYDWDRAAVAAWLNGLADNIEAGSA